MSFVRYQKSDVIADVWYQTSDVTISEVWHQMSDLKRLKLDIRCLISHVSHETLHIGPSMSIRHLPSEVWP